MFLIEVDIKRVNAYCASTHFFFVSLTTKTPQHLLIVASFIIFDIRRAQWEWKSAITNVSRVFFSLQKSFLFCFRNAGSFQLRSFRLNIYEIHHLLWNFMQTFTSQKSLRNMKQHQIIPRWIVMWFKAQKSLSCFRHHNKK